MQFGEFTEVLGGCGEKEFVFSTVWSAKASAVEPHDLLEMCKEHFDFLSSSAGFGISVCFGDLTGLVSRRLMDMP